MRAHFVPSPPLPALLRSLLFGAGVVVLDPCIALSAEVKVGDRLPPWSEGLIDIHHINTGKGESSFFILPDGTSLLVDAGAALQAKPWAADPRPDGSRKPGEWIARYLGRRLPPSPVPRLNYALLTHFHWDHMGGVTTAMKKSGGGDYRLSGITEVAEHIQFEKLIDRSWPHYNWPEPLDDEKMKNYRRFVDWQIKNKGLVVEQFSVGPNTQIVLKHRPERYPNFEIRNLAANGQVWTGVGANRRNHFPELRNLDRSEYPSENKCSIAFRLSYGKFDYFSGGDIDVRDADTGGPADQWKDIEAPIAMVTGPVEACKANHHANYDANSPSFLAALRPRVIVVPTLGASQPAMSVYRRMISQRTYRGPRDIFVTNVMEPTQVAFSLDELKSQQGHVVIRVQPGGDTYHVYVLEDRDESDRIISIHGPYSSN